MVQFAIRGNRDRSMELVMGALPNLLPKLCDLLIGQYKLQKGVKGEIRFILSELGTMKSDLEKVLSTSAAHLDDLDEMWARQVRELSYDLEDRIDTFMERAELIGIAEARNELTSILMEGNEVSKQQVNIVSIAGFRGLGKTALANAVYEKLRAQFDCSAFVLVSQNFDLKKLFKEIVYQLGMEKDNKGTLDDMQLINELREFLQEKRYFMVFDDIWDISVWNLIRQTFPDDNGGSKIITTTRNFKVAEQIGGAYKLKPLSLHESRALLYSKIFGNQESEKCLDEELVEVSDRILKKCAGVPLAITTVANLLANNGTNKTEWYYVYNSVGTGLDYSPGVENMRKILSSSYDDLPYHLRACLLYLSVFPEGHKIEKHRLIWMWIAEGFIIECDEGESLFERGESYFRELISRSLIQLVYDVYDVKDDITEYCHAHTSMFDLICYLSREQNFVTIDFDYHIRGCKNIRKLSLQSTIKNYALTWDTTSMQQVRSVIVFPAAVNLMPALSSFRVLRVLDLQDCYFSEGHDLKYLGILFQLRYLGLRCTGIAKLPEEVGNLRFLRTLDVKYNGISELPMTVVNLRELMCPHIDGATRVPKGWLANLTSLEELSGSIYDVTDIEDLGYLTQLRVLDISCHIECMDTLQKYLVQSLSKLQKVQDFCIRVASNECKVDDFVFPRHIHRLVLRGCWLSKLPAWVNPSFLLELSVLSIAIIEVRQEHLDVLGMLRSLRYLNLKVDNENLGIQRRFIVRTCLFPCLEWCMLWGFRGPVVFERGAMLNLTSLRFTFHVQDMREITGGSDDAFDMFLRNLPSLQDVIVLLRCGGASETEVVEAKAALRHASEIHPNRPTIDIMG
ncbi:hypothetical protein PR202_gb27131 [Eleusine coracana subsp. coracana]|uniref:NB-ARC domain-containing protein n=1 Tax=Eleusine coracana subsp. coracana TaxID=191504 RepID=A0AAV5FTG5_ELECO|nr:hypothetical protein PR202_gb27131 [Eleusine coracana subsp. coracana]